MKLTISVTQEDIDNAQQEADCKIVLPYCCPIVQSLKRTGHTEVSVGCDQNGDYFLYATDKQGREIEGHVPRGGPTAMALAFDLGKKIAPFSFDTEVRYG
jgi:hypothetical protein